MTHHTHDHQHTHKHDGHVSHEQWHDLPEGFAEHLAIESRLSEPIRHAIIEQAAQALTSAPTTMLDIGSGTGADTLALARRFPTAHVHALDVSTELLDRVRSAAAHEGIADRVSGHPTDLNEDWPDSLPGGADLVWASLSIHHLTDPEAALRRALQSLKPGGVLVMTELTGEAALTPAHLGTEREGLAARMAGALPSHPSREAAHWSRLLEGAGFDGVEYHEYEFVASASTSDGAQYIQQHLSSSRDRLVGVLADAGLAGIDDAIQSVRSGSSPVTFTAPRGVWIARRPAHTETPLEVDVAIIGGGSAGLAAAVALARSCRSVVVVDAGEPRNGPAEGVHNVLGNEGIAPLEFLARGRTEAESYGAKIIQGRVTGVTGVIDAFTIHVGGDARPVHARRVVLATGLIDDLPEIPGVREGWGHSVLHCPFCHGWEIRDQRIVVLTRDELALHQALLFRQLSDRVTVFLHDAPDPSEEQWEQLNALGVDVVRPRVERLIMEGNEVHGVEVLGGQVYDVDAAVVAPRFNARTELYEILGGTPESTPFGTQIPSDPRGMTPVPGVWAVGNASQPMAMVTASADSGVMAGSAIHGELSMDELTRAVQERR